MHDEPGAPGAPTTTGGPRTIGVLPAPHPSSLPGRRWARSIAMLVAMVLALDVVALTGWGDRYDGPGPEAVSRALAEVVAEARREDRAWAASVVLRDADLGPTWALDEAASGPAPTGSLAETFGGGGECGPDQRRPAETGAIATLNSESQGTVLSMVLVYPTEGAAQADMAPLGGEGYHDCFRTWMESTVGREAAAAGVSISAVRIVTQPAPVDGEAVAVAFFMDLTSAEGSVRVQADIVAVRRGRAIAVCLVLATPDAPTAADLARVLSGRMGAGPA
jgi:hypothetical protein